MTCAVAPHSARDHDVCCRPTQLVCITGIAVVHGASLSCGHGGGIGGTNGCTRQPIKSLAVQHCRTISWKTSVGRLNTRRNQTLSPSDPGSEQDAALTRDARSSCTSLRKATSCSRASQSTCACSTCRTDGGSSKGMC